jgi:PIN domain nuclease of toxin-antitoxin system
MGRIHEVSRYLLDTNTLIWAAEKNDRLPVGHAEIIAAGDGLIVSIVSFWEIAIKQSLGKLTIEGDIAAEVRRSGIPLLPIELAHVETLRHLPWHHRDPFDRMLIAQAKAENLAVITSDQHFQAYGIELI